MPDWITVPATSAHARLSALDVPTTVAATRGEHSITAWLGNGGPQARHNLIVSLAQQLVRMSGKFLGAAEMLWSGH